MSFKVYIIIDAKRAILFFLSSFNWLNIRLEHFMKRIIDPQYLTRIKIYKVKKKSRRFLLNLARELSASSWNHELSAWIIISPVSQSKLEHSLKLFIEQIRGFLLYNLKKSDVLLWFYTGEEFSCTEFSYLLIFSCSMFHVFSTLSNNSKYSY